jgi:hypothetical protein
MSLKIGVMIKLFTASIVLSQSINLVSIENVDAASFKFTKIADKNTPIPGGVGSFQSFGSPSIILLFKVIILIIMAGSNTKAYTFLLD